MDCETPNQARPICDVKDCNHWKTGLSAKHDKPDLLIPFKKQAWTHLKESGPDLMARLSAMRKEMSCVICNHSCHTLDLARMASKTQKDKCNITNNAAVVAFLLDLLAPVLAETASEKLEETDSSQVVWLELMNKTQVQTLSSASMPSRRRSRTAGPSSIQDRTWRSWLLTFVLELWNFKLLGNTSA